VAPKSLDTDAEASGQTSKTAKSKEVVAKRTSSKKKATKQPLKKKAKKTEKAAPASVAEMFEHDTPSDFDSNTSEGMLCLNHRHVTSPFPLAR